MPATRKKKYEAASEKCRELAERCDQLRYKERILRKKIESSPGYLQAKEKIVNEQLVSKNRRGVTVEGSIQISLEAANLLADGIGYYVKNTDGKWWRAFAEWVEHRVAVDYRLLPARFVLRDPIIVAAIDAAVVEKKVTLEGATTIVLSEPWLVPGAANGPQFDLSIADAIDAAVVEKKMTLEEATAGVLSEPWLVRRAANWPQLTLKDEDVGGTRFKLRREDKLACEWIWTRSGKKHPLDPYRVWHTSVGRHGLADQAGITEDYRPERAINELLWCLSRSDPKHFPFVGEFSREYPVELWAKRVAKWQNDPPDYFAHEEGRKVI